MIGIIANGTRLVLNPNTSIRFTLVNPLYSGEIGYGSQSFSFSIPDNDVNRVALGLKDITFIEDFDDLVDVTLEVGGMPWAPAKLEVSQVPGYGDWKAMLFLDESRLALALKDKMLNEFELGGVRVISTATEGRFVAQDLVDHANDTVNIGGFDYVFYPVKNTYPFYSGNHKVSPVPGAELRYMNIWLDGSFWAAQSFDITPPATQPPILNAVYNLIPMPYLTKVLEFITQESGFLLDATSWLLDTEIQTLTIFNTRALDRLYYDTFTSAPVTAYGDFNFYEKTIDLKNHMPNIPAVSFFSAMLRMFGLVLKQSQTSVGIYTRNEVLADKDERDWRGYEEDYQWEKKTYFGIRLRSELDGNDEFMEGQYLRSDDEFTVAGSVDYYLDLPDPDLNGPGVIYYVRNENAYFESILIDDSTGDREWIKYSYRYDSILAGQNVNVDEIVADASTTQLENDPTEYFWRIPHVQMLGSSLIYDVGINGFGLRFLFYRGLQAYLSGPGTYPQASPDDVMGSYNYSLYWHGERGLYETWWKKWIEFRVASRPVTYTLRLPFSEFFRLDPFKRVRVRTKDAEVSGYWRQLDFTITMDGISQVQMEMEAGIVSAELEVLPVNTSLPAITGTPEVGQTLGITPGTWTEPGTIAYQWYLDGVAISGATANTYVVQAGDLGGTITVVETITNGAGSASATSAGVGPVEINVSGYSGYWADWDFSDDSSYTLSGALIQQISDKSGNSRHLTFPSGDEPDKVSGYLNGYPVGVFDHVSGEYSNMIDVSALGTEFTIYAVWQTERSDNYPAVFAFTNAAGSINTGIRLAWFGGNHIMQAVNTTNTLLNEAAPTGWNSGALKYSATANELKGFMEQILKATRDTSSITVNTDSLMVGKVSVTGNSAGWFGGRIARIIIYSAAHSDAQVSELLSLLDAKYGL